MNILAPTSYTELLASAKAATLITYFRRSGDCEIIIDNIPNDRRTFIRLDASPGQNGKVIIRTLCKFDAKKNLWREYCWPEGLIEFKHKRGKKAFREYMLKLELQKTT